MIVFSFNLIILYLFDLIFLDSLDATRPTQYLGRLLNHSRRGNCKTRVIGINNRPYLILEAARDIEVGEELLYDYGDRSPESLEAYPWLTL